MPATQQQSFKTALAEAFGHRSYVLLVLGFFTCGFQLAFITVHLPQFLADRGISAQVGGWVMASIGLFNMIGSLSVGWLQNHLPERYILSVIYFARALATVAFISFPITPFSAVAFWLAGIVYVKFGSYAPIWWLSILFGVLSALINLPIVEKPVERAVAQPA